MTILDAKERQTGALFGNLFAAYHDDAFKQSVSLFAKRFLQNGFDLAWFAGKRCLDAGCGGGRYAIALAELGAASVVGVDISDEGIANARRRAQAMGLSDIIFETASVEKLPYEDHDFDCVIHSGVLQHTKAPIAVIRELSRVLRPGGMLYALVYATEGLRWPLVQMLRPIAQAIGFSTIDDAVATSQMPVNRRRTYLDDLFVPYIDFYSWPCLHGLLTDAGFATVTRWDSGRLDHEEDLRSYARDLRGFLDLFVSTSSASRGDSEAALARYGTKLCQVAVEYADYLAVEAEHSRIDPARARELAIGQGHHRFVAWKA